MAPMTNADESPPYFFSYLPVSLFSIYSLIKLTCQCSYFSFCRSVAASYPGAFFKENIILNSVLYINQYRSLRARGEPPHSQTSVLIYIYWIKYNILFKKKAPGYEAEAAQERGVCLVFHRRDVCQPRTQGVSALSLHNVFLSAKPCTPP